MNEIKRRRSIRQYTDEKVKDEQIDRLLRAAMQAPSAANQQPWEFLVAREQEVLNKLSDVSPYSAMVKEASVVILLLGNEKYMKFSDYWQQDLAAATQNLLLQVTSENLGAVWLGIAPDQERMKYISNVFDLPSGVKPFALVPVGYPKQENVFVDRYNAERIHYENYNEA